MSDTNPVMNPMTSPIMLDIKPLNGCEDLYGASAGLRDGPSSVMESSEESSKTRMHMFDCGSYCSRPKSTHEGLICSTGEVNTVQPDGGIITGPVTPVWSSPPVSCRPFAIQNNSELLVPSMVPPAIGSDGVAIGVPVGISVPPVLPVYGWVISPPASVFAKSSLLETSNTDKIDLFSSLRDVKRSHSRTLPLGLRLDYEAVMRELNGHELDGN